jgi:hypothetical protein
MRFTRKRLAVLGGAVVLAAALAVPVAFGAAFPGTLSSTDTVQTDRLFRDGIPSNCWTPLSKANPGLFGDGLPRFYDARTFVNATPKFQCVHVFLMHTCLDVSPGGIPINAFSQANTVFDPADPSLDYLGDAGQSGGANLSGAGITRQHFSFVVGPFSNYDVTVSQVDWPIPPTCFYNLQVNAGVASLLGPSGAGVTAARANARAVDHR